MLNCDKISTLQELRRFTPQIDDEFRQPMEKCGYLQPLRKGFTADCTKNRQGLVNQLHSIDFRGDKSALF